MRDILQMSEPSGHAPETGSAPAPSGGEIAAQARAILDNRLFQHSDVNRRLLEYFASKAEQCPGISVKECELAEEVFGLSLATFDPQSDSTVRVRVGRLRGKLTEYYAQDGSQDRLRLEIPKGSYYLQGHFSEAGSAEAPAEPTSPTAPARVLFQWHRWWIPLLAFVAGCGLTAAALLYVQSRPPQMTPALRRFWMQFHVAGVPTMVVFSNPQFSGYAAQGNLHYYSEEDRKASRPMNLTYAGSGDVWAMNRLTHFFDRAQWPMQVQSGAMLSWDSAKASNLIFIDRPEQNPALHQLPLLHEFYFKFYGGIINAHPQPGEASTYNLTLSPEYGTYSEDHAIIAYIPGFQAQKSTLILAGNTTLGSLGAVECVTDEACMASIFDRLQMKPSDPVPHFEAILKVRISNSIPVSSYIVTAHLYPNDPSSWVAPAPDQR